MDCKWIVSGLGQSTSGMWIKWIDVDWNVIISRQGVHHMTQPAHFMKLMLYC